MSTHCDISCRSFAVLLAVAAASCATSFARADEPWQGPPINYRTATANDAIAKLQAKLDSGKTWLTYRPGQGYLKSVLKALDIPESSQVLVHSKTSLQRSKISPRTPRAIYFNDDVYIGWCVDGDLIEVSSVDPKLGALFYTLSQERVTSPAKPRFVRDKGQCLACHASTRTESVPGHVIRSVYVDGRGLPVPGTSTYTTDHESPIEERFGGWYVTGTHGQMRHLGNALVTDRFDPEKIDTNAGANCRDLSKHFDVKPYLTPHSDIVALLVLQHQVKMHNLIARAGYETRLAMHQQREMNKALGEPIDQMRESTYRRIKSAGEPLLRYMLFVDEAALTDPVVGTSSFAKDFVARGPRDSKGRSLREFDLQRWLFQYPCSFLIHSEAWDNLPKPMLDYLYERLWTILNGQDQSGRFDMLSTADREAILTILRETKPNLPMSWRTEN